MRPSRIAFLLAFILAVTACSHPTVSPVADEPANLAEEAVLNVSDPRGGNTMGSGNIAGTADSASPSAPDDRGGNTLGSGNLREPIEPEANLETTTDSVSIGTSDSRGGNTMGSGH